MISRILRLALLYIAALLIMVVGKLAFMLCLPDFFGTISWSDRFDAILAGMAMDNSIAGCITIIPALLTILSSIMLPRVIDRAMRIYYIPVALIMVMAWIADTILYSYWGIKLDVTPLFYFSSSPSLAMASAPLWLIGLGIIAWLLVAAIVWGIFSLVIKATPLSDPSRMRPRWPAALVPFVITLLLFIPIFGVLKGPVSNVSTGYFSPDTRLNHAAVNPLTSVVSSLAGSSGFNKEMLFMDPEEAARLAAPLMAPKTYQASAADSLLTNNRPDIILIILESFSSNLIPLQGGENIAPKLDSIARRGLLFDRFYASSFRTDRAIPTILTGTPAPPTKPLLMHLEVARRLPALPAELGSAGYTSSYYYGGDLNFTNLKDFVSAAGVDKIITGSDFPADSKKMVWGVSDADLFARVAADMASASGSSPTLTIVQTLSSHEPFDVGSFSRHSDPAVNAFAYTDSCLGAFIDTLALSPKWDNTLIVITPDHYGCYPKGIDEIRGHHIPLVMTGGALKTRGKISTPASQSDIAATLLAALDIPSEKFIFSRDILAKPAPEMAFFSKPDYASAVWPDGHITRIDITGDTSSAPADSSRALEAYLQILYSYLSSLSPSAK